MIALPVEGAYRHIRAGQAFDDGPPMLEFVDRHPATKAIIQFFDSEHLPADLRTVAGCCEDLASSMLVLLPDSAELTVGLRKLLEAKDAFVRAQLAARGPSDG